MNPDLQRDLLDALERPHRLGTIGGNLEEQLAHCASFSSVLNQVVGTSKNGMGERANLRGCDQGTGGGLPGIVLAAEWPEMHWTLVDMRTGRADEVERAILQLGFQDRVEVLGIEAQYLGHDDRYRESFTVVVARAFGPPSLTAECAAGLVQLGGVFVVSEPPSGARVSERWDPTGIQRLGFGPVQHLDEDNARFAVFEKVAAAPVKVPRLPPRPGRGWFHQ